MQRALDTWKESEEKMVTHDSETSPTSHEAARKINAYQTPRKEISEFRGGHLIL